MNASEALKQWKTDAWKDPGMVAHYSAQMFDNSGTNRLNNLLEVGLMDQYAAGENILDVGVGTGRASIPLAKRGLKLTGVDSSQSMLDETRRLAGDTPFELKLGDVTQLPVDDGIYDTLISLNVMTHFANWREILAHWASKVKNGGRVIFDVYSLDHLEAAAGRPVKGLRTLLPLITCASKRPV
jgi:2-polyprenyl-3-methyl-5-hydroxy-6-metoxy-1,4-benzoquinol methylase